MTSFPCFRSGCQPMCKENKISYCTGLKIQLGYSNCFEIRTSLKSQPISSCKQIQRKTNFISFITFTVKKLIFTYGNLCEICM